MSRFFFFYLGAERRRTSVFVRHTSCVNLSLPFSFSLGQKIQTFVFIVGALLVAISTFHVQKRTHGIVSFVLTEVNYAPLEGFVTVSLQKNVSGFSKGL